MELHIARDELSRALGKIQGIIEKRSTNPILSHVLLRATSSGLRIVATDTEVSFVGDYLAAVKTEGEVALPARLLHDIVRAAAGDSLHLQMHDSATLEMVIRVGRSRFQLRGMNAQDFPPVVESLPSPGFLVTSESLRELVENTLFSISADETRTGLNGACVQSVEGWNGSQCVRMVSTDGHRLSLCDRPFQGNFEAPPGLLLPRKGMGELRKLCDEAESLFEVYFGPREAVFRRGSLTFSMRLLEGEFPDYPQVIPESWKTRVVVNRASLADALRRVSLLSSDKGSSVSMKVEDGLLHLDARQTEQGSATDEVEAQVEGAGLEIGFNARYFLEVLTVMNDEAVILEFGDSLLPCLVKPVTGGDRLFVVMPVRL